MIGLLEELPPYGQTWLALIGDDVPDMEDKVASLGSRFEDGACCPSCC